MELRFEQFRYKVLLLRKFKIEDFGEKAGQAEPKRALPVIGRFGGKNPL
jgi:hypothetical protein